MEVQYLSDKKLFIKYRAGGGGRISKTQDYHPRPRDETTRNAEMIVVSIVATVGFTTCANFHGICSTE